MKKLFVISFALIAALVATTATAVMLDDVAPAKADGTPYTQPEMIGHFAADQDMAGQIVKFTRQNNAELNSLSLAKMAVPGEFVVVDSSELEGDLTYQVTGTHNGRLVRETRTPDGQPRRLVAGQKVLVHKATGIPVLLMDCLNPIITSARLREQEFTARTPRTASNPSFGREVVEEETGSNSSAHASVNLTVPHAQVAFSPTDDGECHQCGNSPSPKVFKAYQAWLNCVENVCGGGASVQTASNGQGGITYIDQTGKWNHTFDSMLRSRDHNPTVVDNSYREAPFNRVNVRYGDRIIHDGRQYFWDNRRWVRVTNTNPGPGGPSDTDPGEDDGGPSDTDPGQGGWGPGDTNPGQGAAGRQHDPDRAARRRAAFERAAGGGSSWENANTRR